LTDQASSMIDWPVFSKYSTLMGYWVPATKEIVPGKKIKIMWEKKVNIRTTFSGLSLGDPVVDEENVVDPHANSVISSGRECVQSCVGLC
jgi:hypothetical protein